MFHIFLDVVFPTSILHTLHVLHAYTHSLNLHPVLTQ